MSPQFLPKLVSEFALANANPLPAGGLLAEDLNIEPFGPLFQGSAQGRGFSNLARMIAWQEH